ncbi:MAG: DMT family transporter [Acidobacteria bacterium]|nr:MAG: DMT family transporter [Acidobacteriota bacterium]
MKSYLYGLTVMLGVVLTVHLAMNGKVGAVIGNPRVGNALFWCIGAITAVAIGLSGWQSGALSGLRQVNPFLLTAGAMGATLVFAIAWLIPQIGAGPMTLMLLAGQILSAMTLSHFGWLGSPVQPVTLTNIIGALVMVGGVFLATRS